MEKLAAVTAVVACLLAGAAHADREGPYVGIKGGYYSVNDLDTGDNIEEDFDDYAWGGYAGYRFVLPLAVEVEYLVLEEDNSTFYADFEGHAFAASLKPTLDLGRFFELYLKLGWVFIDGELQGSVFTTGAGKSSVNRDEFIIGLGMGWHVGPVQIRLEYQADELATDFFDPPGVELATLGLAWEF